MKLKMFYILSLFACAGLVVKAQTGHRSRAIAEVVPGQKTESILEKDKKALEKNISKEILTDENWIKINDYSLAVKDLVSLNNSRSLFKLSKQSVNDLSSCLKKDFCGMEKRDENDSYFDETKTPGHILLGRNLEILSQTLDQNPELSKEVDWDVIRDLTDSANEKVQVLAVNLLKNHNSKEDSAEKLLKIADDYKGRAKADALVEISADNSEEAHARLLNSITKSFSSDDPNTAISVMEKLPQMHLSLREMEMVANYLCHYKELGAEDHNWKMIKFQMGKQSVQMDTVCP
jgi:hypothetical protein